MRRLLITFIAFVIFISSSYFDIVLAALPSSTHYSIRDYNFGAGGTQNSTSTNYGLNGVVGQVDAGSASSTNYKANLGLNYVQQAYEPPAPTFTNPSSWYNKLSLVLNNGNNPTDAQFLIAVSPDSFTTTYYLQADGTLNATKVWQTYSSWGGGSGITVIGLTPSTTYSVKVSARQGNFTQTGYGPIATAATSNVQFSFSISSNTITMGALTPGSVTTSPTVTTTISTNAQAGGIVWISDANSGLFSPTNTHTIIAMSANLAVVSEGSGAQGSSVTQSSGGPMEILSPYNGSANNVGTLTSIPAPLFDSTGQPVTSGQGSIAIQAKASATTPAGTDYGDVLTLIAAASF